MKHTHQELIGSYFVDLWRQSSRAEMDMEVVGEETECTPTELNTVNSAGGFMSVSPDKLSVKYNNVDFHCHDVGVVQANHPAPVRRLVYYFEIFVKNAGAKGQISIGFTTEGFKLRRRPGWEANSFGYHGDDGLLYHGQEKGDAFGPKYTCGDTVGGGINYASEEFFFTKNGVVVGSVYKDVKEPLFPTVAVHSQNEEITVNFGKQPYVFDIKAYEAQERGKHQVAFEKVSLQQDISFGIVRSYLVHYGYADTLELFDMASRGSLPPISLIQENGVNEKDNEYALHQRKVIRQLIRNGDIDGAFGKLHDWYPQVVQDERSATSFILHSQKFIEVVRAGRLEEAVMYGRKEFEKFHLHREYEDLIKDCAALLAYEEPEKSIVGYLLKESQRELVADMVNAVILSTNPNIDKKDVNYYCLQSHLERLLRQLTGCYLENRSLNGDEGEAFHLDKIMDNCNKKA